MGIFSNCQISLDLDATQVPFKKKQVLRKQVTDNGGVISYILTKKTTHLVASNGQKTADSYKGRTAQKQGVPIVGVNFIERSVEEGKLLDHEDFLLVGETTSMQFSSGKITRTKKQQQPKKHIKVSSFNINKFKVWAWGSVDAPAYPEDKYEVAKSALLQKTTIRNKARHFIQLELHVVPDDVFNLARSSSDDGHPEIAFPFRIFTHRGILEKNMDEDSGTREVRYCGTSEEAVELYSFLYHQQHSMSRGTKGASRWIGSPKYRQTQMSIGEHEDNMSEDVASLVATIWKETLGELEDILAVEVKTLTAAKIFKAESILLQIRKALDSRSDGSDDGEHEARIAGLSQEFYSQIPHKTQRRTDIQTKSLIARKQELCQLIKDVVSVSETTHWSPRSSVDSKYQALRCHIDVLPQNHPQYYDVNNLIVSTQGEKPVEIRRIFAVTRPLELTSFDAKLHNSRLLFHASRPANFVGILSRGLVLPKVVVDDFGGERTDAGMLGSGVYFADSFSTSAKYSYASQTGTRLMAVNQVALGECYQTTSYQKGFTKPPYGFHSVRGVKNNGTNHSDFKDDEYALYSTTQQRIRYVVEFTLPGDEPVLETGPISDGDGAVYSEEDIDGEAKEEEGGKMGGIDLSDVQSIEDPLNKIQPGLLSNNDQPIPLKAVHVRARLLDLAAQVVVLQVYTNESKSPIEAKYVFPLDEQAAVCGFEAFINDKHIVGEVKEKETAHREYKEAISRGHGAYLMDEEKPDVFTVSVGNLPPKTTVVIKITYVAELAVDDDKILFALPGSVAPWRKHAALAQETQTDVATVTVDKDTERDLTVHVAVEMPYDIRSLESPTHAIKHKQTASKAIVCLADDCCSLDEGFQLLIGLSEIHAPRMWAEKHPEDPDSRACMLTFYPEFEADKNDQSEVVLLLDLSNSMRGGSTLQEAKKVVLLTLNHLPKNWKFNIVVFGTDFEELFPQSQAKTPASLKSATNFLQGLSASRANTDIWRPLRAYFLLKSGALRNVFVVSDGHISNEEATLDAVRQNSGHSRVFTFGISATANKYLLRAISTAGAGAFEFFDSKTKSKWEGKVKAQLSKASQPVLTSVRVDWSQFDDDAPEPVQAPNCIASLFSGSRQVVYGFVPYCAQATLRANNDGKDVSTMVSTHELSITEGKILHQLTARNIIRDWEEGALAGDRTQHEAMKAEQKGYIIDLSKKYSIVTQFTSFVAVEVRDKQDERRSKTEVDIADLLYKEEVDPLPYLGWLEDECREKNMMYMAGSCEIEKAYGDSEEETLDDDLDEYMEMCLEEENDDDSLDDNMCMGEASVTYTAEATNVSRDRGRTGGGEGVIVEGAIQGRQDADLDSDSLVPYEAKKAKICGLLGVFNKSLVTRKPQPEGPGAKPRTVFVRASQIKKSVGSAEQPKAYGGRLPEFLPDDVDPMPQMAAAKPILKSAASPKPATFGLFSKSLKGSAAMQPPIMMSTSAGDSERSQQTSLGAGGGFPSGQAESSGIAFGSVLLKKPRAAIEHHIPLGFRDADLLLAAPPMPPPPPAPATFCAATPPPPLPPPVREIPRSPAAPPGRGMRQSQREQVPPLPRRLPRDGIKPIMSGLFEAFGGPALRKTSASRRSPSVPCSSWDKRPDDYTTLSRSSKEDSRTSFVSGKRQALYSETQEKDQLKSESEEEAWATHEVRSKSSGGGYARSALMMADFDGDDEKVIKEEREIPQLRKASVQSAAKSSAPFCIKARKATYRDHAASTMPFGSPRQQHAAETGDYFDEISAHLDSGAAESKFRKHNGDFSLEAMRNLLLLQNKDGFWDLSMGIEVRIGIRLKSVKNMLKEAGVNSLGEDVAMEIQRLVATYLVILYLKHFSEQSLPKSGEERERVALSVLKAESFIGRVEAKHPSLSRRLELGSSWDVVCRDIFKMA